MSHPTYNPNFASNDCCLLLYVKTKLTGEFFTTPEKAVATFRTLFSLDNSKWQKCLIVRLSMGNIWIKKYNDFLLLILCSLLLYEKNAQKIMGLKIISSSETEEIMEFIDFEFLVIKDN